MNSRYMPLLNDGSDNPSTEMADYVVAASLSTTCCLLDALSGVPRAIAGTCSGFAVGGIGGGLAAKALGATTAVQLLSGLGGCAVLGFFGCAVCFCSPCACNERDNNQTKTQELTAPKSSRSMEK